MRARHAGEPTGALKEAIDSTFGSFEEFKKQFSTAGATQFGRRASHLPSLPTPFSCTSPRLLTPRFGSDTATWEGHPSQLWAPIHPAAMLRFARLQGFWV